MLVNKAADRDWQPTDHPGIERSLFRNNETGGRSSVVRLLQGSRFPRHAHHGTEEVVVLSGLVSIGGVSLAAGDYLFTSPGEEHDVVALADAEIFVSSQKATPIVESLGQPSTAQPRPTLTNAAPILASSDIRRTIDFYRERLGFAEVYVDPGVWGIVARDGVQIHFWPCTDRNIAENTACRIYVRGVDALYAEIEPHGIVHPNAALATKPWGAREFGVLDLDGNLITFAERD